MAVLRTYLWFMGEQDLKLSMVRTTLYENLKEYFPYFDENEILSFLYEKGLCRPGEIKEKTRELLCRNTWNIAVLFLKRLKRAWNGPNIPVVILPSCQGSKEDDTLINGVAFQNIILLFVNPCYDVCKLQAILTHEYNHSTRLNKVPLKEEDATFFETMIMEGLAEFAVCECVGKECVARWACWYDGQSMWDLYNKYVKGRETWKKSSEGHNRLLYGGKSFPSMIGYYLGYQIVSQYAKAYRLNTCGLLKVPFECFAEFIEKCLCK